MGRRKRYAGLERIFDIKIRAIGPDFLLHAGHSAARAGSIFGSITVATVFGCIAVTGNFGHLRGRDRCGDGGRHGSWSGGGSHGCALHGGKLCGLDIGIAAAGQKRCGKDQKGEQNAEFSHNLPPEVSEYSDIITILMIFNQGIITMPRVSLC